jgi:hypothetical protein
MEVTSNRQSQEML